MWQQKRLRGRLLAGSFVLLFTLLTIPYAYAEPERKHSSGIAILGPEAPSVPELNSQLASGVSLAREASEKNAGVLSYPYADRETGRVVVTTTDVVVGDAVAKSVETVSGSRPQVRQVSLSRSQLDATMDRLIGRQPEDDVVIYSSVPDPRNNRIILELSASNERFRDEFLQRIAGEYGKESVAVRIVEPVESGPAGRDNDVSPFLGGASLIGCTSGFSWQSGTTEMMLTAGHCYPAGGSVSTPATSMGNVTSGTRENWQNGTGTVLFPSASTHRGDIALIQVNSGKGSIDRIFTGGPGSSSTALVIAKFPSSPSEGDQYCTGGRTSGEQCGWRVESDAAGNFFYSATDETARRVWIGRKYGRCIIGGDSGGPVYTVNGGGQILAKGTISGATGYGGSDNISQFPDRKCTNVFTDIYDAFVSFPGDLN